MNSDESPAVVELPDDAIKALVEAASGIDIMPELLARVPEAVEYVDAWRKTLIDNGSLREESPTNEFLGVVTIAATWAVNGVIAAHVRAEAVAEHRAEQRHWIEVGQQVEAEKRVAEAERDEYRRNWREAEKRTANAVAEAVAEREAIIEVIQQYLPEALPFNTLPEIVGGIARQRDFQHELKDHLAEVAHRLIDERDAAVAELAEALGEPLETPGDHPGEPPYQMTWERALDIARGRTKVWLDLLQRAELADAVWLSEYRRTAPVRVSVADRIAEAVAGERRRIAAEIRSAKDEQVRSFGSDPSAYFAGRVDGLEDAARIVAADSVPVATPTEPPPHMHNWNGPCPSCDAASPVPAEQPPTFERLLTDPLEQFDTRSELLPAVLKYLQEYEAIDPATLMRSVEEYRNAPPATASTSHMTRPAGQPEER